ncbi:MAG TPA: phosphoenolpyruvate--protein phosphotransferase [Verrucomicrobiae bacterium]|jgi:phosphotransferase system enzyme I (PtsI)|nr:phosphoenolpyruvate--protein phosphotransferase [Verrucomicrobiae bacterium]
MPELPRTGEKLYRGIPVSGGVCRGPIYIVGASDDCVPHRAIKPEEVCAELERLERALIQTRHQILQVQRQVEEAMGAGDASIFDAHLLVLEDQTLLDEVTRHLEEKKVNVETAFRAVADKYAATLARIDDDYLRERASDLRDVSARVLNNLLGRSDFALAGLKEGSIIVAHDLTPSATAQLDKSVVLGFATDVGGKTSHTAIMARALQIPAVVGLKDLSKKIKEGATALLDGFNGILIVNPTDQTLYEYGQLVQKQVDLKEKLKDIVHEPAITLDGKRITLSANIGQLSDVADVQQAGAEGVGLFRTEYLFLNRETLPTEEEQYAAYCQVAAALKPNPVVIRTLDLGGDKFAASLNIPSEVNPFLGWRAIRLCLEEKEIFRSQLRAILRASVEGNIKMMYPMVSCLTEFEKASELVTQYRAELEQEGVSYDPQMEIGVMIEIPAAALIADSLGKRSRFFSIGTNDLIQYSLAVDRLNEKIAHLYEPAHPAILQLIHMTTQAGRKNGIWTGVCGEMANDLTMVPLLLGLGVDELSVAPSYVPQVKFLIRRLKHSAAKELADWALQCESGATILERAQEFVRQVAPSLFENNT